MIVILNSGKNFDDLRKFMIDILTKLLKIYSHLENAKNRIIFQILYTFYLLRVLLFICKEEDLDEFSYNSFFQIVYPMEQMHEQILSCMKEFELNEEDKDENSEEKELTDESNLSNEIKKIKRKRKHSSNINKYYQNYLQSKNKDQNKTNQMKNNSVNNNINQEKIDSENNYEEEIIWESDEEKEKFCFYLNYLSIYLLYLHDRNSMKKIRNNNNENALNSIEYNYKNLFQKLEKLLGNYKVSNSTKEEMLDLNYLKLKTFNSSELSKKINIDIRESTLNTNIYFFG